VAGVAFVVGLTVDTVRGGAAIDRHTIEGAPFAPGVVGKGFFLIAGLVADGDDAA